ncbi:LPS export ABC transporter periplasmic protein LptC [Nitrincola alkalilacustris]|uniref:LPS export ABC transporter periplasmic protein LptC n=1 Tax=Nitrincola alkalilacustris TaxID=1571224 RepID=UPI00124D78ED|nr:LPS export ABC transporter periplasmic protein LptC [Nitrincola alkalilacustris]
MFSSIRLRVLLALLIMIPLLLFWGFFGIPTDSSPDRAPLPDEVDFFIRDARIQMYGSDGQLQQEITSPLARHLPGLEQTQLTSPVLLQPRADGSLLEITANEAWMLDDETKIELAGDVQVIDNPVQGTPMIMTTSVLALFPPLDFASTEAAVTFTDGQSRTDAVGMQAWFRERRVELLSEVRGIYVKH